MTSFLLILNLLFSPSPRHQTIEQHFHIHPCATCAQPR